MTAGEMLQWTNRIKEIRNIKDGYIRCKRMENLWRDFMNVYRDQLYKNPFVDRLYSTIKFEYFVHV